jgi:hypothetical protein
MKKCFLVCLILALLCFNGCEQAQQSTEPTPTAEQTQPTVQTTVPEPTQCKHEDLLTTFIREETYLDYGGSCEDPTHVYNQCRDCGEFVFVRDEPSELECVYTGNIDEVIKEATCTEDGLFTFTCRNCGKLRERTEPSKGHQYYWFWGEDTPRCSGCGLLQEDFCNHEYELSFSTEPNGHIPGKRCYQCKNCEKEKLEYFDKYGDYDLRAVKDAVTAKLQALGFQVLEDYDLASSTVVYKAHDKIHCKDTNSKKAPQQLIELSDDVIHKLLYHNRLGEYGSDPANYYAWVRVSYFSSDIASGFNITIYARGTFWEI